MKAPNRATQILWAEAAVLCAVMIAAGYYGPWWINLAPAFIFGFIHPEQKHILRRAAMAGAFAWMIPALLQDGSVGFRISKRIAGVMTARYPLSIIAYALIAVIGGTIACFGSSIGLNLRAAIRRFAKDRSNLAASKQAD